MKPITKWHSDIQIQSLHTAGVAGQKFLSALKERGELVGTRCAACAQVYLPARLYCERCFGELSEDVPVKPEGIIKSFTFAYLDRNNNRLEPPLALALVQLEGATTLVLHRVLDVSEASQIAIGDQVSMVLRPEAERIGSVLDIRGFRIMSHVAAESGSGSGVV
jgi:uncharacterized OB-fold protein